MPLTTGTAHLPATDRRKNHLWIILLIMPVVGIIYWRVFQYPFISEDWIHLYSLKFTDAFTFLKSNFSPAGKGYYRPFAGIVFLILYKIFGSNPIGVHSLALLIHSFSSFLVIKIVDHVRKDFFQAAIVGMFYASSVIVHLDPMMWMVGLYDVVGAFLFFLSILMFMKRHTMASAIIYALALITKEATVIVPVILIFYMSSVEGRSGNGGKSRLVSLRRLLPFIVILAVYAGLRYFTVVPLSFPSVPEFFGNILRYARWSFDVIAPVKGVTISLSLFLIIGGGMTLFLICYLLVIRFYRTKPDFEMTIRDLNFWISWLVVGLLPVLFIPNHHRYYFTYSLAPFLVLCYGGVRAILALVNGTGIVQRFVMICFLVLNVFSSANFFAQEEKKDLHMPSVEGQSTLIARGRIGSIVRDFLFQTHPVLPKHAVLVGDCLNLWSIGFGYAPPVWYNDSTLRFFEITDVYHDSSNVYVNPAMAYPRERRKSGVADKVFLDSARTFLFVYHEGRMTNPEFYEVLRNRK